MNRFYIIFVFTFVLRCQFVDQVIHRGQSIFPEPAVGELHRRSELSHLGWYAIDLSQTTVLFSSVRAEIESSTAEVVRC
jgi:hypothetical protein